MQHFASFRASFISFLDKKKQAYLLPLGLGLLIRVLYAFWIAPILIGHDGELYVRDALRLWQGEAYHPFWPPGFPLYLAPWLGIFGTSKPVLVAAMLTLYLALNFFTYQSVKVLQDSLHAHLSLWFLAVFPACIHFSVSPLSQLPTSVALMAMIWAGLKAKSSLTGVFAAFLVLIRPSNALLALGVLFRDRKDWKKLVLICLPFVCLLSLWLLKAKDMTGRWIPINDSNSYNLYLGNNAQTPLYKTWWQGTHPPDTLTPTGKTIQGIQALPPEQRNPAYSAAVKAYILDSPSLFLLRSFNRVRCFFAFDTFAGSSLVMDMGSFWGFPLIAWDGILYMLLLSALILSWHSQSAEIKHSILAIIFCFALPYWISFSHPTYHFPLIPVFFLGINFSTEAWTATFRTWQTRLLLLFFFYLQAEWLAIWAMEKMA